MKDDRVKIYYDAEFTGLHRNTQLISIGAVSESGAYFYAEFNDYDKSQIDEWLEDNVIAHLQWNNADEYSFIKEIWIGSETGHTMGKGAKRHLNVMMKNSSEKIKQSFLSWLKFESDAAGKKAQFYTDCYAYDWMTLMDLICEDGRALNIPDFIDYIPIDLSTALLMEDVDPDVTRETFASIGLQEKLMKSDPFIGFGENIKHNSLWDAAVCSLCFFELGKPISIPFGNGRTINRHLYRMTVEHPPKELEDKIKNGTWQGEAEHPHD